ncbi:hypothetical protein FZO89_13360 [Luteimonas viscosa]|uniref:Uncharacterized protein n=1 Tax=Luteimonas viscosa TaxID=1132694 RepID=A0A5D4XR46_9GAMM|nr:hypothetical protein [Luteimonas viscosa]TYT27168.1 hypothetical protein FZO89_13360 [Luteimonas viscosa]
MDKRFWICGIVVSFAALLLSFLTHGLLLGDDYAALGAMYRDATDGTRHFRWLLLAHGLLGFAMTWIFSQGYARDRATIAQGLRFGLAMALFSTVPGYLVHYAVQPLPAALVAKQVLFGTLGMVLLGVLLAWLQPRRNALRAPA